MPNPSIKYYTTQYRTADRLFTFIQTPQYIVNAKGLVDDDKQREIELQISRNPRAGPLEAGVRKVRVSLQSRGKSRGARVIYYFVERKQRVYLLDIFAKNERTALTRGEKNEIRELTRLLEAEP